MVRVCLCFGIHMFPGCCVILVMTTERTLESGSSQLVDVSNVFKLLLL